MSADNGPAEAHADRLARDVAAILGVDVPAVNVGPARSGLQDWAASGAMALTGRPDGPPLPAAGAAASAVRGALAVVRALAFEPRAGLEDVDGRLLGERAAITGLRRRGPASVGGALRVLPTTDAWVAVNLPRPEDIDLLPALTRGAVDGSEYWRALEVWLSRQRSDDVQADARVLGLPLTVVPGPAGPADEQHLHRWGGSEPGIFQAVPGASQVDVDGRPVVVLLASLWAGPLAAHLLGLAGCRVLCVESAARPDGTRRGPVPFHDLLHHGQDMVALELRDARGRDQLRHLAERADLVLDGSRPRAMRGLGVNVDDVVRRGTTWLSITGFGRTGPWAGQPAFGDDAACAGGLVARDAHGPLPAGDAIADPLTGVHAAALALAALHSGRSWLLDVALRDVAHVVAHLDDSRDPESVLVANPTARRASGPARPLGADTDRVLREFGIAP